MRRIDGRVIEGHQPGQLITIITLTSRKSDEMLICFFPCLLHKREKRRNAAFHVHLLCRHAYYARDECLKWHRNDEKLNAYRAR